MQARSRIRAHAAPLAMLPSVLLVFIGCSLLEMAPTADFKMSPSTGIGVGTLVTLDATSSSDPQSYALSYEWSITAPSGSTAQLNATDQVVVTYTPDKAGAHTILLRVTSRSGSRKSDQLSKTMTVVTSSSTSSDPVVGKWKLSTVNSVDASSADMA
ncbi:MAG TPA: PKD domain-containing protein, partial [Spirochaetia bacterium]|nr:PKD domain-containing protein [Spirochaetia bacterium]